MTTPSATNDATNSLNTVENRLSQIEADQLLNVRAMLEHHALRDDLVRRGIRRHLSAERHNIFDTLWLTHRENYHSRFVAYLLDPNAVHDQGAIFLQAFLDQLCKLASHSGAVSIIANGWGKQSDAWYRKVRVIPELDTKKWGRIDWVIKLPDGTVIAVENKINAEERPDQISDYSKWLKSLPGSLKSAYSQLDAHRVLVFLTPKGRHPITAGDDGDALLMSYGDLAAALQNGIDACPPTVLPLIETTRQYIQTCKHVHQGGLEMSNINPDILTLLNEPRHLEIALDIEAHVVRLKEEIKKQFRLNIISALQECLNSIGEAPLKWQAALLPEAPKFVGLIRQNHTKQSPNFACVVLIDFSGEIYGGWRRPSQASLPVGSEPLEEEMKKETLGVPHNWWLNLMLRQ